MVGPLRRLLCLCALCALLLAGGTAPAGSARPETGAAPRQGTAWVIETVDGATDVGSYNSLALDAAGRPHISYRDGYNEDLKYAYLGETGWVLEVLDSAGDIGRFTSLALDAAGRPHISYCDGFFGGNLMYARFDGSGWLTETVDGDVDCYDGGTSIALDTAGRPHISYQYYPNADLRYAHFDGVAWYTETVDSFGKGVYNSLALDAFSRPHISYLDMVNRDLKYAHFDGTLWQVETVDAAGHVGWGSSLALDQSGRPHISYGYYDGAADDLKYAAYDGTAWQIEMVDNLTGHLDQTSLALDAAGRPHITYADDGRYALKYAYFDGVAWYTETVDSNPGWWGMGRWNSLALDAEGRPHVSYAAGNASSDGGASWLPAAPDQPSDGDLRYAYLCALVDAASIQGPGRPYLGETGVFSATYTPITATLPAFAWDNGTLGPTAAYSWTVPGVYAVTVTATNGCSVVSATLPVEVRPYRRYIPVIDNPYFIPWR